eukprot:gene20706-biopygen20286
MSAPGVVRAVAIGGQCPIEVRSRESGHVSAHIDSPKIGQGVVEIEERIGDMYGQFPTLGLDTKTFNNPDMVGTVIIPTTSVDQYAATLGAWFGASSTDLATIFPNLKNFSTPNLGFI